MKFLRPASKTQVQQKEAANPFRLAASLFAARSVYFLLGGKSVQLPCATSAAMPMLSPSVGWGWMVLPMSTASAPISIAKAISPIMSPACVPTIPLPKILPWPRPAWPLPYSPSGKSSNNNLVTASKRPLAMARPDAAQGNKPFFTLMPCARPWSSVKPTQATSSSVRQSLIAMPKKYFIRYTL